MSCFVASRCPHLRQVHTATRFARSLRIGIGLAGLLAGSLPASASDWFASPVDYAIGNSPFAGLLADVDRDGRLDMVSVNYAAGTISVLLGDGVGGFGPKADFSAGSGADGVAAGDLNGDGFVDLAATNLNSATVSILLGEDGWERLSEETTGADLLSSVLLALEARRNLIRLAREGALSQDQYKACMQRLEADTNLFVLRDLTLDLCASNILPAIATPHSLDLAHLRTALWFHTPDRIDRFVTVDESQESAAKELGLPV